MPGTAARSRAVRVDLSAVSRRRLQRMYAAGLEVIECQRVLDKAELNIVGEVLRGNGKFFQFEHYPPEDVHDLESHSQYYYHAHRGLNGEHGHFHTFLRAAGMPKFAPTTRDKFATYAGRDWPRGRRAVAHLVAIAMNRYGLPIGLFTVNRWVTDDSPYSADELMRMLDCFVVDHAGPSWPVNRWISAMLVLFRPQIEVLLRERERRLVSWQKDHTGAVVLEDRKLDLTSQVRVSIDAQMAALRRTLGNETAPARTRRSQ